MNDSRKEFLEIVAAVRAHLEFQRALGVRNLDSAPAPEVRNAPKPATPERRVREPGAAPSTTSGAVSVKTSTAPATPPSASDTEEGLDGVRNALGDCTRCKLHRGRKTIVFGEGSPKADVLFVGEGPGYEEDQQGRPFVGAAGQLLTDIIVKGMKLRREDVYICNIVKCRPPNNRNPEPDEVAACIGFVKQQIAAIKPKVIVTLGNVPTQNLLNTKDGITRMRGKWQEYEGIPVMPTFHPSYLLRSPGAKKEVWIDIKLVLRKLGMEHPDKK